MARSPGQHPKQLSTPEAQRKFADAERAWAMANAADHDKLIASGPGPARFENADEYHQIVMGMTAALDPRDFIEATFVKDMADQYWEARRCKRVIATLLNGSIRDALASILTMARPVDTEADVREFFGAGRSAEADRIIDAGVDRDRAFNADLQKLALTTASVADVAYLGKLDEIERLQRLVASLDVRRLATLREFDRYRASASRTERPSPTIDITDAEFE